MEPAREIGPASGDDEPCGGRSTSGPPCRGQRAVRGGEALVSETARDRGDRGGEAIIGLPSTVSQRAPDAGPRRRCRQTPRSEGPRRTARARGHTPSEVPGRTDRRAWRRTPAGARAPSVCPRGEQRRGRIRHARGGQHVTDARMGLAWISLARGGGRREPDVTPSLSGVWPTSRDGEIPALPTLRRFTLQKGPMEHASPRWPGGAPGMPLVSSATAKAPMACRDR